MWIYPVDMKRANEFGQTFEKEKVDKEEEDKKDNIQASTAKKRTVKANANKQN